MKSVFKVACKCVNDYQDVVYGKNNRLCNKTKKAKNNTNITVVRCTVCGTLHDIEEAKHVING